MITALRVLKRLKLKKDSTLSSVINSLNFRNLSEIKTFFSELKKDANTEIKQLEKLSEAMELAAVTKTKSIKVDTNIDITKLKGARKRSTTTQEQPKIVTFKGDAKKLEKSYNIIDSLHDKVSGLDVMINMLSLDYRGEKEAKTMLTEAKALRVKLQKTLDKAYTFLTKTAVENEPDSFSNDIKYALKDVMKQFDGFYETVKQTAYVVPYFRGGEQLILFSRYVEFKNFENTENITYPKIYLMFNCVLTNQGNLETYVNASRDFVPPSKVSLGTQYKTEEDCRATAYIELQQYNFITLMERTAMGVTEKEVKKIDWNVKKDWIKSVSLADDIITVTFTEALSPDAKKKDREKAIQELVVNLQTFFRSRLKAKVESKPFNITGKKGVKYYGTDLILTLPDSKEDKRFLRLDGATLRELENKLDLTPKQATELVKQLNKIKTASD